MTKRVISVLLVAAMCVSMVFAGGGKESSDGVLKFKLAENQPQNNPITEGMVKFAELVEEKTNGTVLIEVYPDAMLGQEVETIDQVQAGTLDFARVNASALLATVPSVGVFTLPYIFTGYDQKYRVLDGEIGQSVLKDFENYNMVGLSYWEAGSRNFYTTDKAIKSVADMKGLKIRVQPSEVAIRMVELLGGVPTPMAYGEVFQGLQTGVIDGAENDFVSYYTSGHYEAAKNFSLDGHVASPATVLCSMDAWNKMNDSQKAAVKEAAQEAAEWQRKAMSDFQNESRAEVEKSGTVVYDVNVKEFQDAVAPMYDMYPEYAENIAAIRNVK